MALLKREVVDAGNASLHKSMLVELPVFIAIGAEPMTSVVVPFVGKADGDTVAVKSRKILDQTIVQFLAPLADEKLNNRFTARQKLNTVAPDAIVCVSKRNSFWVTGIP